MTVKIQTIMMIFAVNMLACNVQNVTTAASDDVVIDDLGDKLFSVGSCTIDEQDFPGCDACAKPFFPDMVSPDAGAFHQCYNNKANGCLVGDGSFCESQHPEGAQVWLAVVDDVCNSCAAKCCYFCATKWGKLAP